MNLGRFIAALAPDEVVLPEAAHDGGDGGGTTIDPDRVEVHDVAYDPRLVTEGAVFFCIRGANADGHDFAAAAVAAGAAAIVCERRVAADVPQLIVPSVRLAMPVAADLFFGHPSGRLKVAGITGTNGKTTTAFLLQAILEAAGRKVGLLTNIERRVGGERRPTGLNTPEAIDLQRLLAEMADAGDDACVLEATSEASAQGRLLGTRFAVAVFTNLTQDHLNFHGTMEAYFEAKAAVFEQAEQAVINVGDEWGRRLAKRFPDALTFDPATDALDGVDLHLRGGFNRANALAAAFTARALGVDEHAIKMGIESIMGVPGRFESIEEAQPFTVIVDYAHTPDSLENVLTTARTLGDGTLTVVFGAGGDRDRTKRPIMGAVAARLSDRAVLTSDNPRSEDPAAIAADVAGGDPGRFEIVLDRREAIERALTGAAPGDVIVIAGRGAEPAQESGGEKVAFDDRAVARELLRSAGFGA